MDAIRLSGLLVIGFFAAACSQNKTSESVFPNQNTASASCGKQASQNRFIVQWEDGRFTVETDSSPDQFRHGFVKNNLAYIKHVDHDYRIQLTPQQNLSIEGEAAPAASDLNWGPAAIQADALWSQNIKGDGIIVAVVDGMVDVSQAQLQANIATNPGEIAGNGVDDDNNGFIDDYQGIKVNTEENVPSRNQHGTHVAGIIAADSTQGPVQGIAPRAKILPAQFIGNEPTNGQGASGSIGDAIIAMNYAASRGAKIINMSWGVGPCVQLPNLQASLQQLSNQGILLVTAAGNGDSRGVGYNVDIYPTYPSAYNLLNQINVAASTISDSMVGFSNYGMVSVHIAAPGVNIYSTVPNNGVASMSGTSMASPMTAGAAALLWSAIPSASATQIKQAIVKGVDVFPGRFEVSSKGRLNVSKAYTELKKLTGH
ncbi:MAG: S8 family serine peptidase [Bdellovibrio sp.]|nr:S8 family serine peptidase [Bdellovibrio sp.]